MGETAMQSSHDIKFCRYSCLSCGFHGIGGDYRTKSLVTGDIVFMSPASASFDLYSDFEERGDHFKRLVMELK